MQMMPTVKLESLHRLNVSHCQPLTGHGHELANAWDGHEKQGHTHA
jgi:hypothetical protein